MSSVCSFFWPTLYINFQYVCGIHVVGNEMKWFTFYAPPCMFSVDTSLIQVTNN